MPSTPIFISFKLFIKLIMNSKPKILIFIKHQAINRANSEINIKVLMKMIKFQAIKEISWSMTHFISLATKIIQKYDDS